MKKISFIISISLVLASIFGLSGCKKELNTVDDSMTFDSLTLAETYYLNSDPKQPSCNIQVDFVYPKQYKDEKILSKMQVLFIDKILGGEYLDLDPETALQAYKDKYIENFKQFEMQIDEEEYFSYYLKLKSLVVFNEDNIVSLFVNSNIYEGGAHGSNVANCYVFDLAKGTIIAEKQIFTENYKKQLASIIVDKIVEANNLADPQKLGEIGYLNAEEIISNDNFIINEKGITYYFNEYEIAAYVVGITEVFIPFSELTFLLKEGSPIAKLAGL